MDSGSQFRGESVRKFLPLDVRISLYEKVLALRKERMTYKRIMEEIKTDYGIRIPKSTISYWTRGASIPVRAGNAFTPRPSPELAYVIGVESGDGFLNVKLHSYQYRVRLSAVDREFVEAFSEAVSKVLNCSVHSVWKGETAREYQVEYGSFLLHKFLLAGVEGLKNYIEYDKDCASAFLRGFFDSEGCMGKTGSLTGSNSDFGLLVYVQLLLKRFFGIETTGPRLSTKKGSLLKKAGKFYVRRVDCYSIYIRTACLLKFHQEIGLTIERKRARLERKLGLRR